MKNIKIIAILAVLVTALTTLINTNAQTESEVGLDILGWVATYNVSGSIHLSWRTANFDGYSKDTDGVHSTFEENSFVLEDLIWTEQYNVTILSEDLTEGSANAYTIGAENIYIKSDTNIVTKWSTDCSTSTTTDLNENFEQFNNTAINLFNKANDGTICKAALTPTIWVDIPANQPVGEYTATLTIDSSMATHEATLTYE